EQFWACMKPMRVIWRWPVADIVSVSWLLALRCSDAGDFDGQQRRVLLRAEGVALADRALLPATLERQLEGTCGVEEHERDDVFPGDAVEAADQRLVEHAAGLDLFVHLVAVENVVVGYLNVDCVLAAPDPAS